MIAVDYDFYSGTYKGRMPQEEFERMAVKASAYLDTITFGRLDDALPEDLQKKAKLACCEAADMLRQQEEGGEVVSASNGQYSESYAASGRSPEKRLYLTVATYLQGTGLLFAGRRS